MAREEAAGFAERLAGGCSEILGEALVAAIVHGSLVNGDYTPARSDVDLGFGELVGRLTVPLRERVTNRHSAGGCVYP
jgi:hypothetical protein